MGLTRFPLGPLVTLGTIVLSASAVHAVVPEYTVLDLGTLGGIKSEAYGLNDAGQVVGWSKTVSGANRAFLTAPNSAINPANDMLPTLSGGTTNFSYAVNSTGQVAGDGSTPSGDRAYRYGGGTITSLGTLGGGWSYGYSINGVGQVVGSAAKPRQGNNYPTHAFLYSGSTMYDLGTLGGQDSYANGINASGKTVGYSQLSAQGGTTPEHAFVWSPAVSNGTSGVMSDIGSLGGDFSYAFGINDAGQIVGGSSTTQEQAYHAFLRSTGPAPTMIDLGTLGGASSEARAINATGLIVGFADTATDVSHAFLYVDGLMHDLNNLVSPNGGWSLTSARAINDLGQIAGYGTNPSGQTHGFLLTPIPAWNVNLSGSWSTASNWLGGVPDGVGREVRFTGAITAPRTVTLDIARTAGHVVFDNANRYTIAGPGTLTIDGSQADTGIEVRLGGHTISAPVMLAHSSRFLVASGASLNITGSMTATGITIQKSGDGFFEVPNLRTSAVILDQGKLSIAANGTDAGASRIGTITIAGGPATPTAALDLNDNDMIVASAASVADVVALVIAGRSGGSWTGNGITSSAARNAVPNVRTLGVLVGADYTAVGGGGAFSGLSYGTADTLVKYTYYGDTDFNGLVDFDDYVRIDEGYNAGLSGWAHGDSDLSGAVEFDDYALIDFAYNGQNGTLLEAVRWLTGDDRGAAVANLPGVQQVIRHVGVFGSSYAEAFIAAVPEPAGLGFLTVVALASAGRRRRSNPLLSTQTSPPATRPERGAQPS